MEITTQVLKPFGPLIFMADLPNGTIKTLNEIADEVQHIGDMGPSLAGIIKKESEIPHYMLEEKDGQIEFTFNSNNDIFTTGSFVARPKPGMCILIPNSLYHQVYPFQGSGERRSIAFNMSYKGFKKDSGIQIAGDSVNLYNETNHADTIPWRVIEQGYHK